MPPGAGGAMAATGGTGGSLNQGGASPAGGTSGTASVRWLYDGGTRLKASFVAGGDIKAPLATVRGGLIDPNYRSYGGSNPLPLFDTKLSTYCTFRTAEDGSWRCLPENAQASALGEAFADASCQQPVAFGTRAYCPTAKLITWWVDSQPLLSPSPTEVAFAAPAPVFDLGIPLSKGQDYRLKGDGTSCEAETITNKQVFVYPRGAKRPPSDFVKGERTIEAVRVNLKVAKTVGEDGSEAVEGWYFPAAIGDTPCDWRESSDAEAHCLPVVRAPGPFFLDDKCKQPSETAVLLGDAQHLFVPTSTAATAYQIYERVPGQTTNTALYVSVRGNDGTQRCFARSGRRFAPTAFPPLALVDLPRADIKVATKGTIGHRYVAVSSSYRWHLGFQDLDAKIPCWMALGSDDKFHCLTETPDAQFLSRYTDSDCTQRLQVTKKTANEGAFAHYVGHDCGLDVTVFQRAKATSKAVTTYFTYSYDSTLNGHVCKQNGTFSDRGSSAGPGYEITPLAGAADNVFSLVR